jgi:quinol monooxygenase YgiN
MKTIFTAIFTLSMFIFISCENNSDVSAASNEKTVIKTTVPIAEETPFFEPFKVVSIVHTVKDFDEWRKAFDAHISTREASGLTLRALARGTEDPNKVFIVLNVSNMKKANAFINSIDLKKVMQKANVTSKPDIIFANVIRMGKSPEEFKGRLRIGSRVKDFDAWLKIFDAEGKETRATYGLIDRAIAQNVNNPNIVYLTFAVTDLEKAKARLKSPELKKLMDEAGVLTEPVIDFYISAM